MRFNKTTQNMIHILAHVHWRGTTTTNEISAMLQMPRPTAKKLVNDLVCRKLLTGQRGRRGGVRLVQPASEMHLGQLLRELETPTLEQGPPASHYFMSGDQQACEILDAAFLAYFNALDRHTLADLHMLRTCSHK